MAVIYPNYDVIRNLKVLPTEGELKMIDFLLENLDDEYEIYFQPFLNGDCPDIILMKEGGGVLIIEVKDWKLGSYHLDYRKRWFVSHNNVLIKSPISQVLKYKENMYDLHIQNLLEFKLRDYRYWYVVNCSVFFYKENKNTIKEFLLKPFEEKRQSLVSKNASKESFDQLRKSEDGYLTFLNKNIELIGKDNLNSKDLKELLERRWISKKSSYFTHDLYESFKRYLKPSFHSLDDGRNFKYTKKQLDLSTSKPGEQKIKGIVGSGKTLVLAKRAVNAHLRTSEKVLILTYNISLKNYIHDKVSNVREDFYWKNFHIVNYHDFFNSVMNNLGIEFDIPEDFDDWDKWQKEQFFHNKYYGNFDLFKEFQENIEKYSAILIDEVQDYNTIWLRIIKKYFLIDNGEFVVFGDSKQDIYDRVSLVNNKKELIIPESPGRWSELNQSFRLTPTITAFASSFQKTFLADKHSPDEFENVDFQSALFDKVYYKYFSTLNFGEITQFIKLFSTQLGSHPNDVCVLSLSIEVIREIDYCFRKITKEKTYIMSETKEFYDHLKEANGLTVKFNKEIEKIRKNKKLHFWMNSGLTKFSTVHSYKGWEIKTLFLIVHKDTREATYKELIYTGFTRCMNNLIIIDIDDHELSKFMDGLEYVQLI
ncbi:NERD domain-containing protein/DEAD/DEAH box helicase [Adhaeribacter rhizoryzae]|uniref:DNA 3'-5' helicase II n=1 Tax=Adhaeribacter rhizoryzae TaxID=2607907 RepID=A0A5M6D4Q8_9BACT|nr:NERD domain-containing protein/DEAD/DEAH box helicase [Adhaeribacter rhizoryzae]KAA5542333.1 AAA family ATPase [Adhaeribacter rhizoryzae]